jgi:hypothetical protein
MFTVASTLEDPNEDVRLTPSSTATSRDIDISEEGP